MKALLPVLFLVACSCPSKPAATPQEPVVAPGPAPTQTAETPPPVATGSGDAAAPSGTGSGNDEPEPSWRKGPGMGENCGPNDTCAQGLTCVSYYGIAGARGPEFKTCEIRCSDDSACPRGTKCITIADGPGQVCRP